MRHFARRSLQRLLVNQRLGALWCGQVIAQTGDSVYQIGMIWLLLDMTDSSAITGLGAAAAFLPALIFGLVAGVVADRHDRPRIMIISDAARMGLVLLVPALWAHGWLTPLALGMITFAIASFAAFFNPARDSLVPDLVNERDLPHANALIQTSWQVAILLGPVAAAFILSATANDVNLLFVLNAATYGVSLACILVVARAVRTPLAATFATPIAPGDAADPAVITAPTPAAPRGSVLAELREGLAFAWANPVMRIVLIVTAIDNIILMGPAIVGIPLFVREVLQAGPTSYSWIQAALAGGVIAGVPFMAVFGKRLPLGKTLMWGVVLDGLTYMPLAWITTFEGAVITVFLHSVFIPVITVTRTTLVQRHVPPRMRGRMFALIGMCVIGGTSISVALTGWAAESMSVHTIYLAISIGAAATALPGFFSKGLRDADAAAGR